LDEFWECPLELRFERHNAGLELGDLLLLVGDQLLLLC
jgi:RNA-directed DNA polymerase